MHPAGPSSPEPLPYDRVLSFSAGTKAVSATVRRLTGPELLRDHDLHAAMVELYCHILPDISRSDCVKELGADDAVHVVALRTDEDVRRDWEARPVRLLRHYAHTMHEPVSSELNRDRPAGAPAGESGGSDPELSDARSGSSFSGPTDDSEPAGRALLEKAQQFNRFPKKSRDAIRVFRRKYPRLYQAVQNGGVNDAELDPWTRCITPKDRILGAASAVIRRDPEGIQAPFTLCQLTYIGVRTRFQLLQLGRRLCSTMLLAEAIQTFDCDAFFTYAGSNAVRFFRCCGLDDDPLIAGRFAHIDNQWTDVLPMVRVLRTPRHLQALLEGVGVLGAAASPAARSAVYREWRDAAFRRYTEEASLASHLISELDGARRKLAGFARKEAVYESALAQERSRCIMYEQIISSLEEQLLTNGIKPTIDKDRILESVMAKVGQAGDCAAPPAGLGDARA